MRILSKQDIERALPMRTAVAAMRNAFTQLATGQATVPPRPVILIDDIDAAFLTMPAYARGAPALAVKAVGVFPRNKDAGLAAIQGAVLSLDPSTGRPQALLEGASLTAIRTGAASGVATDFLAREDASTLAVFGAGAQARTQVAAVRAVRDVRTIRIFAPTRSHARSLAAELSDGDVDAQAAASAGEALRRADIVCTATNSSTPVFDGTALDEGVHVNAVGSFKPTMRELDLETVRRMDKVVVDTREGAWAEAGELVHARDADVLKDVHAELGDLCAGTKPGREDGTERTLFKSVGNAVQDAVAAQVAYEAAVEMNLGVEVDFGDE